MTRLLALSAAMALLAALVFWQMRSATMVSNAAYTPAHFAEQSVLRERVPATGHERPALPRVYLDTRVVTPAGRVITVPAGGRVQAALNAVRPGDVIELSAGATFVGNFVLPKKSGAEWVTIRSSAHENLPPPGSRISSAHATLMPKIVSPNTVPAISTAAGAHHYRFIGIEVTTTSSVNFTLVLLESPRQTSLDRVPTDIVFDRCYIHGTATGDSRRGIALNGARLAVIDSYLADFHERGADSQAMAGWNGPGPVKIVNNYLEAAGENVMFGGADPTIPGLVPGDIEIRGNHLVKPLAWKADGPRPGTIPWTVKNLFELKNARRVLVDGNVFEQNWVHAQDGFAILFTVRNQDGAAPWSVVEDVTFTNNMVRHTASAMNILGHDSIHPSEQTKRILIANNVFDDIGTPRWGGGGRLFQLLRSTAHVVIEHNTAFQTGSIIMAEGAPHASFTFKHNLAPHNTYGIIGTGTGTGNPTLLQYFPGAIVAGNVLIGGDPGRYPPGNLFPASLDRVGFADLHRGDYRLSSLSPYKRAAGGRDPGADIDALWAAVGRFFRQSNLPGAR